jgi:hypothetical protein
MSAESVSESEKNFGGSESEKKVFGSATLDSAHFCNRVRFFKCESYPEAMLRIRIRDDFFPAPDLKHDKK